MKVITHLALAVLAFGGAPVPAADDPLPSWNDTAPKKAVVAFVERVTKAGSPDFVPVPERIATFDKDGTLWAEQPIYTQVFFIVDRVKALAPQHPEWRTKEPFASLLKGDLEGAAATGEAGLAEMVAATHSGMSTDEFSRITSDWIATAKHPKTGRPFTRMAYQPMLELLAYLRANGFKTFIVSGGGVEFMRPWTESVYGIPPEQAIGSTAGLKFEMRDGSPVLMKLPTLVLNDDKDGKPVGIQRHIGRRPIAAFGNSDGDLQMLQWTAAGPGPRFCLYVHHTDAEREWAYDRQSHVGRLDKGLDEAKARGWTVVIMKDAEDDLPEVMHSPGVGIVVSTTRSGAWRSCAWASCWRRRRWGWPRTDSPWAGAPRSRHLTTRAPACLPPCGAAASGARDALPGSPPARTA